MVRVPTDAGGLQWPSGCQAEPPAGQIESQRRADRRHRATLESLEAARIHHKEHLTPENISNPWIAFGESNLELLCRECHALAHAGELATDSGLTFDEDGNVVKREFLS